MAIWAKAAYPANDELRCELNHFLAEKEGAVYAWNHANAAGLLAVHDGELIIGIAGSDSGEDWRADFDTASQGLADWAECNDLPLCKDATLVKSTAGFCGYAALCYRGVAKCLKEHDLNLSDFDRVYFAAHSLGQAAVVLLQYLVPFQDAEAHTYGGARPIKRTSYAPKRDLTRAVKIFDPVQWIPITCKHPRSKQIIVRYRGSIRNRMPLRYKPVVAIVSVAYWVLGTVGFVLSLIGIKSRLTIVQAHSMESYCHDVEPHKSPWRLS